MGSQRESKTMYHTQRKNNINMTDSSSETLEVSGQWNDNFKTLKGKTVKSLGYPAKYPAKVKLK